MLQLTVYEDKWPEVTGEVTAELVAEFAKSFGASMVEIIKQSTGEAEWVTNEQRVDAVLHWIKTAKAVAYFKMQDLNWIDTNVMSLDQLMSLDDVATEDAKD